MSEFFFSAKAYFKYWLLKEDQFSQQSPFVFSIYFALVTFLKQNKTGNPKIEQFRSKLLSDHSYLSVTDLGAGSRKVPQAQRKVSAITRYSTSGVKFAQLYQFFCSITPGLTVIELGTCMGISTRYLALSTKGTLYSLEGSAQILDLAKSPPTPPHTQFLLGAIEQTLPPLLKEIPAIDFALIDANHTYEGTMFAFNAILSAIHKQSIVVIGDIHWSKGMEQAWKEIRSNPRIQLTLDFFECGVLFFDYPGEKNHLILAV